MKFDDLIEVVKDDAYNIALERMDIYPSKIIGLCLYRHKHEYSSDDDIIKKHNPFGTVNPKTGEILSFDTLYDGITNGLNDNFVMNIVNFEEVDRISKIWSLSTFDIAFIKTIDRVIIDLDDNSRMPFVDMYTVKKGNAVLASTSSYDEAFTIAQRNEGSVMVNSRGKVIDLTTVSVFKDMEKRIMAPSTSVTGQLSANTKIICNDINLYNTPQDSIPTRCISGTYYVYDDTEINDMIHICKKSISNGSDLTIPLGYIKKSELTT